MNKYNKLIACILCIVTILSGCKIQNAGGGDDSTAANNNPASTVNEQQSNLDVLQPAAYGNVEGLNLEPGSYISLIGRSSDGVFWETFESGASQAIDDINKMLGYEGDDEVKFSYNGPDSADSVEDQVNLLDEELALYPTALGIATVDSTACEVQFDLAMENGIPIIAFESGSEYDGIQSMVTTNNTEASQTAAKKLCQSIDDEGEVLVFVHDTFSAAAIERANAFTEEIEANHPGVTIGDVYHMDNLETIRQILADKKNPPAASDEGTEEEDTAAAEDITDEEVLAYILEQHPDAKGCVTSDAQTTQTVLDAVKEKNDRDMQIVGFEGGEEQLQALQDGDLARLIVQNPYGMGYASVVAAARSALSQGNEAVIDCGYVWVTKDNMDTDNIKRMLY